MTLKYDLSSEDGSSSISDEVRRKFCDPLYVLGCWKHELKSSLFWRAVGAEVLGTGILVFFGAGSTIAIGPAPSVLQISFAAGFAVGTAIWILAYLSEGHFNPAITIGTLLTRRITLLRAVLYVPAQCGGSIGAAFILKMLTPEKYWGNLGATLLNHQVTVVQGVFVEFLITFVLVFCFFAVTDQKRDDFKGSGPLTVALSVIIGHVFALNYTGASMNPAASLGPAVIMNIWTDYWVYVCGPISGGVTAGLMYDMIFSANASLRKIKDFLTYSRYDRNKY